MNIIFPQICWQVVPIGTLASILIATFYKRKNFKLEGKFSQAKNGEGSRKHSLTGCGFPVHFSEEKKIELLLASLSLTWLPVNNFIAFWYGKIHYSDKIIV